MPTGTVKWFDVKKGFGFIVNAEGKDVFVHFTSIEGDGFRSLKDGEKVEYEETGGAKGLSAKSVRRLKPAKPEIKPAATAAAAARMNAAATEMDQPTASNTAST
jgi:CspA family cold shock protein